MAEYHSLNPHRTGDDSDCDDDDDATVGGKYAIAGDGGDAPGDGGDGRGDGRNPARLCVLAMLAINAFASHVRQGVARLTTPPRGGWNARSSNHPAP